LRAKQDCVALQAAVEPTWVSRVAVNALPWMARPDFLRSMESEAEKYLRHLPEEITGTGVRL
jgi:hypothetical protein